MSIEQIQRTAPPPCRSGDMPVVSVIMPTTAWTGTFEPCAHRVLEMLDAAPCVTEFVVVYDGRMPKLPAWLHRPGVRVASTRQVRGPAAARNLAAQHSRGSVLFFVDADVELAIDALDRVRATFTSDDPPVAVFGAYDSAPVDPRIVSRFRNLLHHHTHVTHPGDAGTFWSGCGAVNTSHFHDVGGFDETYVRPSIEDIELGTRMVANGGRIVLDPLLQGKHHKAWTLRSMVFTDVYCRAIPWTRLILAHRHLPATLNTDWRSRASGMLAVVTVAAAVAAFQPAWAIPGVATAGGCILGILLLNLGFYGLCLRRYGPVFAAAAAGLHLLFFGYSSLAFGSVVLASLIFDRLFRGHEPIAGHARPDRQPSRPAARMAPGKESRTA